MSDTQTTRNSARAAAKLSVDVAGPGVNQHFDFEQSIITVGQGVGCDVRLTPVTQDAKRRISRLHARLMFVEGQWLVECLSSTGMMVDGDRVGQGQKARLVDESVIGLEDYRLRVRLFAEPQESAASPAAAAQPEQAASSEDAPDVTIRVRPKPEQDEGDMTMRVRRPAAVSPRAEVELIALKRRLHAKLIQEMDLWSRDITDADEAELREDASKRLARIFEAESSRIPGWVDRRQLAKDVLDEALGLGPLEELLADPEVTEIMVVGHQDIFVERGGKLTLSDKHFSSDASVRSIIERIVAPLGRRIDESQPLVDARLKDGSRVNAVIPPLSLKGPCITIRKFAKDPLQIEDLIRFGTLNERMAEFLKHCVMGRKNIIISGGTGSGKTTLLNVLSSFIPSTERIVTIEDAAELQLRQRHVVTLQSRPPNIEGRGEVTIRDLVKNALRMRPDRIVVGECRGAEALDMLQAMNTGHDGSLTTAHANSPEDMLRRLEVMTLMAGEDLPVRAIREQVSSAIDVVVQQTRFPDGSRKITYISEVVAYDSEEDEIVVEDIFRFRRTGWNEEGRITGEWLATGYVPSFLPELIETGVVDEGGFL